MSAPDTTSLLDRLGGHVAKRVTALQTGYGRNDARAVADLAILRRGVGKPIGADAALIALTTAGLYDDPETLPPEPTPAEKAAYTALTLFALHQRSQRAQGMHRAGESFGRAMRLLGRRSASRDAVRARFNAAATAATWDELVYHVRGLILQLRAHDIPLDYGRFARDLFLLQLPRSADRVRIQWGRDFYRVDDEQGADDATTSTAPS